MDKRLEDLSQVNDIKQYFIKQPSSIGFPFDGFTIYSQPEFISWREKVKYQLRQLKPSDTIEEIISLLDGFDGWNDEKDFEKLQAKIQVILDNPDDFLPEEVFEETMENEKLKKGTIIHTAFDDYELIKQIGQGGNGKVFSAKDSDGKEVAIKFIDRNESDKKYKRFKNEISFCENSDRKNIVKIFDRGYSFLDNKEFVFYVMPLYKKTLRDRIESGINADDAVSIFIGILNGLKYAHENGTIHRDIKPENILFAENSIEPVICDFGIAHFSENELITAVETKAADRLANFQYAAPEQRVKGGANNVKGQADVYAAGLILNEMFTGEIPQSSGYKKIEDINPEYAYLDKLFEKLYKQNPNERLFPISEILIQFNALKDYYLNEQRKKQLEKTVVTENEIKDFTTSILDKYYRDDKLVFVLDKSVPREWIEILKYGSYNHTSLMGYEPNRLNVEMNMLIMPLKGVRDESRIKTIVKYVESWIPIVNDKYSEMIKNEEKKRQRQEEMKRKAEIEELEKTQSINSMLAGL